MRITLKSKRTISIIFSIVICLAGFLIISVYFPFFQFQTTSPVLHADVSTITLYAHNVSFPDGEYQKKEVLGQANIGIIVDELLSIQYVNHPSPPDDLGGGWTMIIALYYNEGSSESYEILFTGSEKVIVYPPSGDSTYGIWPNGETLWDQIDISAEIIDGEEMRIRHLECANIE